MDLSEVRHDKTGKCPNCGNPVNRSDTDCLKCGVIFKKYYEVEERKKASQQSDHASEAVQLKSTIFKKWPIILSAVALISILLTCTIFYVSFDFRNKETENNKVHNNRTINVKRSDYKILHKEMIDTKLKTQETLFVLVSKDETSKRVREILTYIFDLYRNASGFKHSRHPNSIWIYAYDYEETYHSNPSQYICRLKWVSRLNEEPEFEDAISEEDVWREYTEKRMAEMKTKYGEPIPDFVLAQVKDQYKYFISIPVFEVLKIFFVGTSNEKAFFRRSQLLYKTELNFHTAYYSHTNEGLIEGKGITHDEGYLTFHFSVFHLEIERWRNAELGAGYTCLVFPEGYKAISPMSNVEQNDFFRYYRHHEFTMALLFTPMDSEEREDKWGKTRLNLVAVPLQLFFYDTYRHKVITFKIVKQVPINP